jgi:ATP adenylyltransferase
MGVSLDRLWAGWRSDFVGSVGASVAPAGGGDGGSEPACVFCAILASGRPDAETHVLWRDPSGAAVAMLNAYPYTSGHLMVMPVRHVGQVEDLTSVESATVWEGVTAAARAVKSAYRPEALNLGANVGRAAGAGVPGHFHLHVLPRWIGDTNFMTTVANTRVLPEALSETDRKLRAAWPSEPSTLTTDG